MLERQRDRNISVRMFNFLRAITHKESATYDRMRAYDQRTLWAVLDRGYVRFKGSELQITDFGYAVYSAYMLADMPVRQKSTDLTTRVKSLLHAKVVRIEKEKVS